MLIQSSSKNACPNVILRNALAYCVPNLFDNRPWFFLYQPSKDSDQWSAHTPWCFVPVFTLPFSLHWSGRCFTHRWGWELWASHQYLNITSVPFSCRKYVESWGTSQGLTFSPRSSCYGKEGWAVTPRALCSACEQRVAWSPASWPVLGSPAEGALGGPPCTCVLFLG